MMALFVHLFITHFIRTPVLFKIICAQTGLTPLFKGDKYL